MRATIVASPPKLIRNTSAFATTTSTTPSTSTIASVGLIG